MIPQKIRNPLNLLEHELYYAEKICDQEKELRSYKDETRRKDKVISELEAQLEAAKISNNNQIQIEEISTPAFHIHSFGCHKYNLLF